MSTDPAKLRAFWLHYNKPESRKQRRNVLTIHYEGACHLVHAIKCLVPIVTKDRKRQPYCVMAGRGVITFTEQDGRITATIHGADHGR